MGDDLSMCLFCGFLSLALTNRRDASVCVRTAVCQMLTQRGGWVQWATVYQAVGQLVREFESGMHEKIIESASADVREAIRFSRPRPPALFLSCNLSVVCCFGYGEEKERVNE